MTSTSPMCVQCISAGRLSLHHFTKFEDCVIWSTTKNNLLKILKHRSFKFDVSLTFRKSFTVILKLMKKKNLVCYLRETLPDVRSPTHQCSFRERYSILDKERIDY